VHRGRYGPPYCLSLLVLGLFCGLSELFASAGVKNCWISNGWVGWVELVSVLRCGFIPHWTPWATCARLWTCGLLAHSHVSVTINLISCLNVHCMAHVIYSNLYKIACDTDISNHYQLSCKQTAVIFLLTYWLCCFFVIRFQNCIYNRAVIHFCW